ncbi:MAG: hypothetical protein ACK55Z_34985, partial [bacterium]
RICPARDISRFRGGCRGFLETALKSVTGSSGWGDRFTKSWTRRCTTPVGHDKDSLCRRPGAAGAAATQRGGLHAKGSRRTAGGGGPVSFGTGTGQADAAD